MVEEGFVKECRSTVREEAKECRSTVRDEASVYFNVKAVHV